MTQQRPSREPLLHWITAAAGAAIFLACVGYLGWLAFFAQPAPVSLQVVADSSRYDGVATTLHLTVRNRGRQAAADVHVVGEWREQGEIRETAEQVFRFVPGRSARAGALLFSERIDVHAVHLRAASYTAP